MRLIVITQPFFFPGEAQLIDEKFRAGLWRLHLRKPGADAGQLRALLDAVPSCWHGRIVLHDHFELLDEYELCGVHLNSRNPSAPRGWKGHVSASCHSLEELAERKNDESLNYLSLSPIYDSISKKGYASAFSPNQLREAGKAGIIDSRVMALGGISEKNIPEVMEYGFGGVMLLGAAWPTAKVNDGD